MIALREAGQQVAGHIVTRSCPSKPQAASSAPELAATLQSPIPPGDHFIAFELSPGSIEGCGGRVRYARAFGL